MEIKELIKSLPYPIEKSARYIYGALPPRIKYGQHFWRTYNLLKDSQYWSLEKLKEHQLSELGRLLEYAYNNVPYYQRIFSERKLTPSDIRCMDDLQKLPFLTKEIIRENTDDLISVEYKKKDLKFVTTGGSTGNPLGFYADKKKYFEKEWAFMVTQWERVGYRFGSKSIVLRGNIVNKSKKDIYWEYDPVFKNLHFSTYDMNDSNLPLYIKKIRDFKPDFIWNYPSAAMILARYMKNNKIKPFKSVKALLCGSENLYPAQKELLKEVFDCRIYSWYGHTEQAVLAGECEESGYYHIFPEYGIVELVNNNEVINIDEEYGEIVATGFNNHIFPFIRYRTMDIAKYGDKICSCGRNYKLFEKVEGRTQDLIVTRDGRLITLTALIFAQHYDSFSRLKEMQIVQERKGEVLIRIVKSGMFTEMDIQEIESTIYNAVGEGLKVSLEFVDKITRTRSGKMRFLIQKLSIDHNGPIN